MSRRAHVFGSTRCPVLLVGEAPGREMKSPRHTMLRRGLAQLAGVRFPGEFIRLFARANVLGEWPGKAGPKGDAFPLSLARPRAERLSCLFFKFRLVVLTGRRVSSAFGLEDLPFFEWREAFGTRVAVSPHPSGVNRWWNEPLHREAAAVFWLELGQMARIMHDWESQAREGRRA